MLASPRFAEVKRLAGEAARRVETDEALQVIADIFWFTLEFGVIREDSELKAYGAGILSSGGEIGYWEGPGARNRPDLASRIIFITGDIANEETVATLRDTGAPCVEKPFRVRQFISVVEKTLGKAPL